ncbi:hypothetical protein B0H16DRAFT_1732576 [Mycena metata]|uniref:Uncharacterized protein n=1 Tax=Mycena metata TaxID=1033252 RepID=A0AAD7I1E5_9AGAR|nr:hypothetical protein B0H16DRAFT_1732576 [Mycena metata]
MFAIDPALEHGAGGPPAKKQRIETPRHRKKVTVDPLELITGSISARMVSTFMQLWITHELEVTSADPDDDTDEDFPELCEAAVEIIEHVEELAETENIAAADFKWDLEYDGSAVDFGLLVQLHKWLIICNLAVGSVEPKAPRAKKAKEPVHTFVHNGHRITLTPNIRVEARTDPSAYPGCVEAGLDIISAVLKNRSGGEKCLTCGNSGTRGKAMGNRPIPPPADHPYLSLNRLVSHWL